MAKQFDRTPLDKKHTIMVNKLTDIDRYGREGKIDEKYVEPKIPDFEEKEVCDTITWRRMGNRLTCTALAMVARRSRMP